MSTSTPTVNQVGDKIWVNNEGKYHREDGPAIEQQDGYKAWWINGKCHREDGPAIVFASGSKAWFVDGLKHRLNGPALEWFGCKIWYCKGLCHREDGPAMEYKDGTKRWFLNGYELGKEQYYSHIYAIILNKIGKNIVEMFDFDWTKQLNAYALADYLDEQGNLDVSNQIRNLIGYF